MRPAAGTALLGLVLILVAATFDAEPLYVPGVAFVVLAGGAVAWVWVGARGVRVTRKVAAHRALEEEPVEIDLVVRAGAGPRVRARPGHGRPAAGGRRRRERLQPRS